MKLTVKYNSSIFVTPSKIPNKANTNKNLIAIEKKKICVNSLLSAFLKLSKTHALLLTKMALSVIPDKTATPSCSPTIKKLKLASISSPEKYTVPFRTELLRLIIIPIIELSVDSSNH
nr:hypothetical protein [Gracilimonas sp.]